VRQRVLRDAWSLYFRTRIAQARASRSHNATAIQSCAAVLRERRRNGMRVHFAPRMNVPRKGFDQPRRNLNRLFVN
jgi:hypothetical protein